MVSAGDRVRPVAVGGVGGGRIAPSLGPSPLALSAGGMAAPVGPVRSAATVRASADGACGVPARTGVTGGFVGAVFSAGARISGR